MHLTRFGSDAYSGFNAVTAVLNFASGEFCQSKEVSSDPRNKQEPMKLTIYNLGGTVDETAKQSGIKSLKEIIRIGEIILQVQSLFSIGI